MKKVYVVGIDIGGTNTAYGVVDARGNLLATESFSTCMHNDDIQAYVDELSNRINALISSLGLRQQVVGIGVGVPNGNYFDGTIGFAVNLPWRQEVPLAAMLSEKLNLPVTLANDANAATIGEMTYGAAKGMKNFILITLGTGIGSGIVIDGKLIYGSDGYAGELGHVIVEPGGRLCGCGRRGCLETYASATGVVRTAKYLLQTTATPSALRNINPDELTSKEIYEAALNNDSVACEVFSTTGEILGRNLANFVTFSSPEAIILFGGLTQSGALLLDPLHKAFQDNLLKIYSKVKVLTSELKEGDAAILGAAAIGWEGRIQ